MEQALPKLFVYGTLRSGFHHPAYAYISNNFILIGAAKVKGKLYDLGEFPAAIPTEDENYIIGELYELHPDQDFNWVIEQLDDYEGLHVETNETSMYRRELTTIYINDSTTKAWMYWYNKEITGKPLIASGDVLEYLQQKQ
jgi:gamma-glutamylcyclotransferase (GGCT)/AIG2-like uncharacterized protein YtfP